MELNLFIKLVGRFFLIYFIVLFFGYIVVGFTTNEWFVIQWVSSRKIEWLFICFLICSLIHIYLRMEVDYE